MTVALTATKPKSIIRVYADAPGQLRLPTGDQVYGATAGWISQDGKFALVAVTAFTAPDGQVVASGTAPSYSFDAAGNVIETYATVAAPAPPPPPPPTASSKFVRGAAFIALFTDAEYAAIKSAAQAQLNAGSVQLQKWIDTAEADGGVDVLSPVAQAAKAALVAGGLLTQVRADVIFG